MTHPTPHTHFDSSLYDEKCLNCGATDGNGMAVLDRPCPSPLLKVEPPAPWPAPPAPEPGQHGTVLIEGPCGTFLMLDHVKAGQYRFPGGRLEAGELPIAAAARELKEELDIEALELRHLRTLTHHVSGRDWVGHYYLCTRYNGVPRIVEPTKHTSIRYLSLAEMQDKLATNRVHQSDHDVARRYHYPRGN
jgi:8-oxo-dGTP pyrophosphatase MutT (NUDIX family)